MSNIISLSHDPFARTELLRARVYVDKETCTECGQVHVRKSQGTKYLYVYGNSRDDSPLRKVSGRLFCSIGCFRAYYGSMI